ncbi:MAG: 4-(cytidine 5'-diphospho)-2-C-methyl-D-erythritol kinase [Alistipes sp.]
MILRANCKINVGLDILYRRVDRFHELVTVMYPVRDLYDEIEVSRTDALGVRLYAEGLLVNCADEENICLSAFEMMHRRYGVDGVLIRLDKRIPFGAGLGGGSSDATSVILALNELFELNLSEAELIDCASSLGSDMAFFVRNTPQLCTGRGEIMTPFELDLSGMTLVIIKPPENVSTREAYAGVRPHRSAPPLAGRLLLPVSEWQGVIKNDFEPHVFATYPSIRLAKECLLAAGAIYASLSGSGSAVYGLFEGHVKSEKLCCLSPYVFEL